MLATALAPRKTSTVFATVTTVCSAIASYIVAVGLWKDVTTNGPSASIASAFGIDGFSIFFTMLILIALAATAFEEHSSGVSHCSDQK